MTELWDAAYNGDIQKLQELLADPEYRDMINYKMNSQGHSALFFACYGAANAETVRLLLNAGADPFQRDDNGCLPLHFAANSLDPALIAALLEVPNMHAFKHDVATASGQTPLHALFVPGAGDGLTLKSKNADLTSCLSFFLERDKNPLGALHKKDNNGLSSLMLVKYYNLQPYFYPHVPPKTFGVLLSTISVPGNIADILKDFYRRIPANESTNTMGVSIRPRLR